jgi:hypothetical protein|uniref:Uncharacterized protein n=1 Tax=Siphoviridae sp. ctnR613 TaxID=2827939 RepID=A0A8S5SNU8_9CAUD|nr:MAG TPA: hypothetical protein [Siphoviridae sp. ctnR613]
MNIQSYVKSEFTKYIRDCEYMTKGQRFTSKLNDYTYEIGRHSEYGYLYANVILEDDKELYQSTLALLQIHNGITYNKIHNKRRVIGFDCNGSTDYIPYGIENEKTSKYKDMKYVKKQIKLLIEQLRKAGIH